MAVHGALFHLLHFQNLLMTIKLVHVCSSSAAFHFDQYQLNMISVFMELNVVVQPIPQKNSTTYKNCVNDIILNYVMLKLLTFMSLSSSSEPFFMF